jgi:phosphoenolpyruvate synthase/pyruvate phosphate dikinase
MADTRWSKLLARQGVDVTTISGIDLVFFEHIREFSGRDDELFFSHLHNRFITHYIGFDAHELGRSLYKKYFFTPEMIKKHHEEGNALWKEIEELTARWQNELDGNTAKMLLCFKIFRKQFGVVNHIFSITSWLGIEAWQNDFEKLVPELITRNKLDDRKEQIYESVSRPWKKTAIQEAQADAQSGLSTEEMVKKYQFLRSWVAVWYSPIDNDWVDTLKVTSKHEGLKVLTQDELVELLKPTEEEKAFLAAAPYVTFFKDRRDDVRRYFVYSWTFLFEAIAKHFSVEQRDVGYLTLDEIEEMLGKDELPVEKIKYRKNNAFIITSDENMEVKVIDSVPEKYQKIMDSLEDPGEQKMLKGLVAQAGKARGKAIIIHTYHDIKRVEDGDILIANTTHPNFLPGMQKAAGFVTNEGGIISHTAIVAREMKKPCIVGTKTVTKIVKDGQMVEVDGDKGEVNII